jgi:methyltransferase
MELALPIVGAVALMRVAELIVSRWRLARDGRQGVAAPLREPVYPLMVAVHAMWLAGCLLEPLWLRPAWHPFIALPALLAWALALGLRLWSMAALGRLWNVRLVRRAEQPVITAGPYRYVRHPNYLAVVLELAAVPLAVGAYWTALLAGLASGWVLWRRIAGEEAYLFTVPGYAAAFAGKKRLIPGLF